MPNPTNTIIPTPITTTIPFAKHPTPIESNNPHTANHPTTIIHQFSGRAKPTKTAKKPHCPTNHHQHTNHTIPHTATQPNSRSGTYLVHNFQYVTHLEPVDDPRQCLHPPQVYQGSQKHFQKQKYHNCFANRRPHRQTHFSVPKTIAIPTQKHHTTTTTRPTTTTKHYYHPTKLLAIVIPTTVHPRTCGDQVNQDYSYYYLPKQIQQQEHQKHYYYIIYYGCDAVEEREQPGRFPTTIITYHLKQQEHAYYWLINTIFTDQTTWVVEDQRDCQLPPPFIPHRNPLTGAFANPNPIFANAIAAAAIRIHNHNYYQCTMAFKQRSAMTFQKYKNIYLNV